MIRRPVDPARDFAQLFEMQRQSFSINFPGSQVRSFSFRASLRASARHGDVYAYELEGELVGWLWLDRANERVGHIRHIQVAEPHWGKGLGRQILLDAIRIFKAEKRTEVTLNVTKSNKRAMALYSHVGFRATQDHGERQFMQLSLGRFGFGYSSQRDSSR